MVRLSKLTDYAVVLLTQMVRRDKTCDKTCDTRIATTSSLCEITGLAHPTVSKILKRLTKTGLLIAHRGATGGYELARAAQDISVADIITALDGPIALTDCAQGSSQSCTMEKNCPINGHWNRVNLAIRNALQSVSLAEMANDIQITIKPNLKRNAPKNSSHLEMAISKYPVSKYQ